MVDTWTYNHAAGEKRSIQDTAGKHSRSKGQWTEQHESWLVENSPDLSCPEFVAFLFGTGDRIQDGHRKRIASSSKFWCVGCCLRAWPLPAGLLLAQLRKTFSLHKVEDEQLEKQRCAAFLHFPKDMLNIFERENICWKGSDWRIIHKAPVTRYEIGPRTPWKNGWLDLKCCTKTVPFFCLIGSHTIWVIRLKLEKEPKGFVFALYFMVLECQVVVKSCGA